MKFNLLIGLVFLTIFSATSIKSVDSQLDFVDSNERIKKYYGGKSRQKDQNVGVRQLPRLLVGYGDQPQTRVGVDPGLLEPPPTRRGRVAERAPPQQIGKLAHVHIVPQSICVMKADPGYCNLMVGRWYYDHRYHRCLPFLYTGCGGNLNNFISVKKCTAATMQCHYINTTPLDSLTKHAHALLNPLNPFRGLAEDFILAG